MSKTPVRIAITSGDIDGIGPEIVAKALSKFKPKRNVLFYLWRSPTCPKKHLNLIDSQYKRITVKTWPEALAITPSSSKEIVDIASSLPPAAWVEQSAKASLYGHLDGIATAPLSKVGMHKAGFKDLGHTDLLKRVTKTQDLFMTFLGKQFSVLLATGHIPVKDASRRLKPDNLEAALRAAHQIREVLPKLQAKKPIGLVGINPHAGEDGLIGIEEEEVFSPALKSLRRSRISVDGPLVPDVAFNPPFWKKYSIYVSPYHDQGLIPFKMVHGQESGVHITMGLPFIRTSVDHGTAKNIFGKNKANPSSMINAIDWAVKLCARKKQ